MKTTKSDWLIPAGLVVLSLVPALAGTVRLGQIANGAAVTAENARFLVAPIPIITHIVSATIYSLVGAFMFSPGLRRRHRDLHRTTGKVLAPFALLVAVSGLWMTLTYPWGNNDAEAVYVERLVFGTAMLVSVVMGIDAVRRRRFTEHGEWMIRAYAIGVAAGTQVFTHLPWFLFVDMHPGTTPRAVMMGLGWVINVVVAEWIIRRPVTRARPVLVAT